MIDKMEELKALAQTRDHLEELVHRIHKTQLEDLEIADNIKDYWKHLGVAD